LSRLGARFLWRVLESRRPAIEAPYPAWNAFEPRCGPKTASLLGLGHHRAPYRTHAGDLRNRLESRSWHARLNSARRTRGPCPRPTGNAPILSVDFLFSTIPRRELRVAVTRNRREFRETRRQGLGSVMAEEPPNGVSQPRRRPPRQWRRQQG